MSTSVQINRVTACASCASDHESATRHRVDGYVYVHCPSCGAARLDAHEPFDAVTLFDEGYFRDGTTRGGYPDYEADAVLHRRNANERIARLTRCLQGRERPVLIDVGCASGYVLDAAAAHGWSATGVDISEWARAATGARGLTAFASLAEAIEHGGRPDAVTFFQSLEHLAEPTLAVEAALEALPTGGVLAIETWDADSFVARMSGRRWQQINPPTVRHLFTRRSLHRLLERSGAQVVEARATAKSVSPRLAAAVISHHAPRVGRPLERLTAGRLGGIGVRYRLGDLITVVAVKRAPTVR